MNKTQMAASLGISIQAFDKWGVEPICKIGRNTYFDARSVVENRLADASLKQQLGRLKHQPELDEDTSDLEQKKMEEDYLWTRERRIAQQLKNEIAAQQQVPTEFANFALSKISAEMASILDTLPLTMRRKHPDLEARHLNTLNRELAKARNQAASLGSTLPDILDDYLQTFTPAA